MTETHNSRTAHEIYNNRVNVQVMLAKQDRINLIVVCVIVFLIVFEQLTFGIYLGLMYVKYPGQL